MSLQTRLASLISAIGADVKSLDSRMAKPCVRVVTDTTLALYTGWEADLEPNDRVLATNETNKANNGVYLYDATNEIFVKDFSEIYTPGRIFPVVHKTKLSTDRDYTDPELWVCTSAEPTGGAGGGQDGILFEPVSSESVEVGSVGAMELIATVVTVAGQTSIVFNNIPQNFKDLKLFGQLRSTVASENVGLRVRVNNSAAANYNHTGLQIDSAASPSKFAGVNNNSWQVGQVTANTQAAGASSGVEATFPDYTRANDPLLHFRMNTGYASGELMYDIVGRMYGLDAAINRIDVFDANGAAFVAGSTLRLYGIRDTVGSEPLPVVGRAYKNANQAISAGSWTKIGWDAIESDNANGIDLAADTYTVQESGEYIVAMSTQLVPTNVAQCVLGILRNISSGTVNTHDHARAIAEVSRDTTIGEDVHVVGTGRSVWFNKGEIIAGWIYLETAQNIRADSAHYRQARNWLSITRVQGSQSMPLIPRITTQAELTAISNGARHGQEIDLVLDATLGVVCRAKYNAGSASPYKWEVSGSQKLVGHDTQEIGAVTQPAWDAALPTCTLPFAGDWLIGMAANVRNDASGNWTYCRAAASAADAGTANKFVDVQIYEGGATGVYPTCHRENRINGLAAGAVMRPWVSKGGGSAFIKDRTVTAAPYRVG